MALACFGLLITACNPGSNSGGESKPASSSGAASTSSKPSTSSVKPQSNNPSYHKGRLSEPIGENKNQSRELPQSSHVELH